MSQKIIDIHSHMFNLKYLPVAGIIVRYSDGKVPQKIARGIEWLLLRKTDSSFESDELSYVKLNAQSNLEIPLQHLMNYEKMRDPKQLFQFSENDLVEAMSNLVTNQDLNETPLTEAIQEFIVLNHGPSEAFENPFKSAKENENYFTNIFGWLKRMLDWLVNTFNKLKNYIKWFLFMTRSEKSIYQQIANVDSPDVALFVHHMMDVDSFFDSSSYYNFPTRQVDNMQKLNAYAEGKLMAFVAFNPMQENWHTILDEAISQKGFKGVKFYPPMGYKANGDKNYEVEIDTLFKFCNDKRIPLFTHCNNQGFEANPNSNSGYNSNPIFWEEALKKYPDLILCLAHGGGVQGWFSEENDSDCYTANLIEARNIKDKSSDQDNDWNASYAAMVFKLCVTYPNVYTDAAYLDEMILPGGGFKEEPHKRFKNRLLKIFKTAPNFANKIMYGSDWHMLFQEGINAVYLNDYIKFFEDKEFDPYRNKFFYQNAMSYLSLK